MTLSSFELGLGLVSPWKIVDLEFRDVEVHIEVDFERGGKFDGLPVHDTTRRSWRHQDFFKYPCYIEARVPRVKDRDGKVRSPWSPAPLTRSDARRAGDAALSAPGGSGLRTRPA